MSELKKNSKGNITCVLVTDAAKAALLAVYETFDSPEKEGDHDPEQHRHATIAALKAAIVACGGD